MSAQSPSARRDHAPLVVHEVVERGPALASSGRVRGRSGMSVTPGSGSLAAAATSNAPLGRDDSRRASRPCASCGRTAGSNSLRGRDERRPAHRARELRSSRAAPCPRRARAGARAARSRSSSAGSGRGRARCTVMSIVHRAGSTTPRTVCSSTPGSSTPVPSGGTTPGRLDASIAARRAVDVYRGGEDEPTPLVALMRAAPASPGCASEGFGTADGSAARLPGALAAR